MESPEVKGIDQVLNLNNKSITLKYINHHKCHIASTFYPSEFSNAAVLTVDGRGDEETGTFSICNKNKINTFQSTMWPHSLGLLYAAITQFLGFTPHSDEWKVMALAAYGDSYSAAAKK